MKTNGGTAPLFLTLPMGCKQVAKYTPWSFYFLLKKNNCIHWTGGTVWRGISLPCRKSNTKSPTVQPMHH